MTCANGIVALKVPEKRNEQTELCNSLISHDTRKSGEISNIREQTRYSILAQLY